MMILSLIGTNESFAYWASDIVEPTAAQNTTTIHIGEWDQAFPYNNNNDYEPGDLVIFNGNTYEATSSFWSNVVSPTGFLSFLGWRLV
jgi:hypothetical protein